MALDRVGKDAFKDGGKGIGAKIDRADDASNFFAKCFVKSDLLKAVEMDGSYVIRDNMGNPIVINPRGGVSAPKGSTVNAADILASLDGRRGIEKSQSDSFRDLGKQSEAEANQESNEKAFVEFVNSLTDIEVKTLNELAKDRMLVSLDKIVRLHKMGKELGTERLIDHELITWTKLKAEGMVEFRITGLGRKVLNALRE